MKICPSLFGLSCSQTTKERNGGGNSIPIKTWRGKTPRKGNPVPVVAYKAVLTEQGNATNKCTIINAVQ